MKILKLAFIFLVSAYLFGCASPAKMENMVYQGNQKAYPEQLRKNVDVSSVSGGKKTNPAWTSEIDDEAFSGALKQSLSAQGLLSDKGGYQLEARLLKVEQPMFGFDIKVTTHVQYILTDVKTNSVVLDKTVVSPYTATVGDAFAAVKRLRLANEGSGKKNIEGLLDKLSALKIRPKAITLKQ